MVVSIKQPVCSGTTMKLYQTMILHQPSSFPRGGLRRGSGFASQSLLAMLRVKTLPQGPTAPFNFPIAFAASSAVGNQPERSA
jgi:hypothetical protein